MLGLLAFVTVMAAVMMAVAPPAGAQAPDESATAQSVSITVESVSPWVASDGDWSAELRVSGAPADARLSYSIRQPASGTEAAVRDTLIASRAGDNEPKVMRRAVTGALSDATDAGGITRIDIAVRSSGSGDRSRTLIPNSGVHPVVVTVTDAGGSTLGTTTVYLTRLPVEAETPEAGDRRPMRVGVLIRSERVGGFDDTGELDSLSPLRTAVDTTVDLLDAAGSLPVEVDLAPESIVALTTSGTQADRDLIDRLLVALDSATVLRVPWADLHLEAWATSGTASDVRTSLIDGQEALFARLQRPIDSRLWPSDRSAGPNGVQLLSRLGVSSMLVEPSQLTDTRPPSGESGLTRPFRIQGTGDTTVAAMALDPELEALLTAPSEDPALAAHQIVTQLLGSWLADTQQRGAVLEVDPTADAEIARELFAALLRSNGAAPFDVVDPVDVVALPVITVRQSGRDTEVVRDLVPPDSVPTVSGIAQRLAAARPLVDDYAAMLPRGDEVANRDAILIQRSLDRRLSPVEQEVVLDRVISGLRTDLGRLTASGPRTLTVTSRNTSVPLRFTNDLGRPVRVRLRLQSPRLVFIDGAEQTLTLEPGLNRFDVRVDVRASGQFVMQADLVAPGSDRVLASTRQTIRSRAFSGVGLMLSGGALLFLVIWWSRTLRRRPRPDEVAEEPGVAAGHS